MNWTKSIAELQAKLEQQEQRIDELQANLTIAGCANIVLTRILLARELAAAERWRPVLDDLASAASADLRALPIKGDPAYVAQVRHFADQLICNNLDQIGDAIEQWDREGRPMLTDDLEALN